MKADWWEHCDARDEFDRRLARRFSPPTAPAGAKVTRITDDDVTARYAREQHERDAMPRKVVKHKRAAWAGGQ